MDLAGTNIPSAYYPVPTMHGVLKNEDTFSDPSTLQQTSDDEIIIYFEIFVSWNHSKILSSCLIRD